MRVRDRLISGAVNAATDVLLLILILILYSLLSSYMAHLPIQFTAIITGYITLIVIFILLAFLRGLLAGHVLVYPVILGEATLITAIFLSIPGTIAAYGVTVNITPLIYFLWSIEMAWIVYSIIEQFNSTLLDP
ncbi:hypothetical protein [Vulcanisaeta souniana]|uniref:Uncharacterized protein n=1 Tax=Vulcanisaeta souniana JCM 11219 TaxID=1293586 RepID=A0A830EE84_9CREN|nr:hypothetical protein [Vulcanisaeta souniana]BDR93385.1 hypothetical protein Vsou_24780 [Vulcanisaeta souniana JCM 11219]GGI76744.1 hypothetical protein GCM10007112_11910 [Vulcanisaeta souniana JCM 11219]